MIAPAGTSPAGGLKHDTRHYRGSSDRLGIWRLSSDAFTIKYATMSPIRLARKPHTITIILELQPALSGKRLVILCRFPWWVGSIIYRFGVLGSDNVLHRRTQSARAAAAREPLNPQSRHAAALRCRAGFGATVTHLKKLHFDPM